MRIGRRIFSKWTLFGLLFLASGAGQARADASNPTSQEELIAARVAWQRAHEAQAERYAAPFLRQAEELLDRAEKARQANDDLTLTQASLLARRYAELAQTIAELKGEEEKLAATRGEWQRVRNELDRLLEEKEIWGEN